jgi:hypothetical protein
MKPMLVTKSTMSLYDRCVRINVDNWISGGFDIGACFILLSLHVLILALRLWECAANRKSLNRGAGNGEEGIEMADLAYKAGAGDMESAKMQRMDGTVEEYARIERRGSGTEVSIAPSAHANVAPETPYRDRRGSRKTGCSGASVRKRQKCTLLDCLVGDGRSDKS